MKQRILVVDDEVNNVNAIVRLLRRQDYSCFGTTDPEDALPLIEQHRIRVVISDQRMPKMQGSELFEKIKQSYPDVLCILLSAYTDFDGLTQAINSGVLFKFISKPWRREELLAVLDDAFAHIELQRLNKLGMQAYSHSDEAMLIIDRYWRVTSANAAYINERHQSTSDVVGKDLFELEPSLSAEQVHNALQDAGEWQGRFWLPLPDGALRFYAFVLRGVENQGGEAAYYTLTLNDQTLQQQVEAAHQTDLLTGLCNRQAFLQRNEKQLHAGQYFGVLALDVVNFRQINQSLGHSAADQLLLMLSQRLQSLVPSSQAVARIGGDHFSVLMEGLSDWEAMRQQAESWLMVLRGPYELSGGELFIALRGGLSIGPSQGSAQKRMQEAETALAYAKQYELGPLIVYDNGLMNGARERLRLWSDLHRALEREEFELLFQPKVSALDGSWKGAEALLRWHHPMLGAINPDIFVTLAEESGLIMPIGRWVIAKALDALQSWRVETGNMDLHVAVNMSPAQLSDQGLVQLVVEELERRQLPPSVLELEITETQMLEPEKAAAVISDFARKGIKVVLDDFGTGYASFQYLRQFEFSCVKLDKTFIDSLESRSHERVLVKAMIDMAHSLSLTVVAEGVERNSQWFYLKSMGCDLLQGYRFSIALPAQALPEWARQQPVLDVEWMSGGEGI
ncbi:EAL domain-containing protein [Pokkaliibacter sp. MBI-7]|uniref:EAL domain-containing response regulator n=1 Tax=Pokkaliibacter sp. MBI-7 TaxID=3040600 RepID=UPI00244A71C9|nr:EAL domain-containing protein [Pokkaliibacter sp. MBI-7]MDH2431143.1 EAL domain-containing protein [Pokkaliibacter sp. MBI-7]